MLRSPGHAGLCSSVVRPMKPENVPLQTLGSSFNAGSRYSGTNATSGKRPSGVATICSRRSLFSPWSGQLALTTPGQPLISSSY
jgi:hypothetical protein